MGLHWSYDMAKRFPLPPMKPQPPKNWHVIWEWSDTGMKDSRDFATETEAREEAANIEELGEKPTVMYKEPYKRK